jgi:hypothetical protein
MLRRRIRRAAARGERAVERLAEIEASIRALPDDDLLDLADIFKDARVTPLGESAFAEMTRRNLSL